MGESTRRERELEARIRDLETEVERLRGGPFVPRSGETVHAPADILPLFQQAQETVGAYFRDFRADPSQGTIEIGGERYVLIRAAALSFGFLNAIRTLYADRGDAEALRIGKTLLYDMAHVIGIHDARAFHERMGLTDPVAKLSAGPVLFAYAGWAFVDLLSDCRPEPGADFYLHYNHPFSFESDSWIRAQKQTDFAVCVMNAGYSSGWCEESFGVSLAATELTCRARGDDACAFVMAPPHRMQEHVRRVLADAPDEERRRAIHDIPTLFERKAAEERTRKALAKAEAASEAKSLFLANMSHEIRTPLTGVIGMANLLLRRDLESQVRRYVETIEHSGHALLQIVNDILDFSKLEAGMMAVNPVPTDLRDVFFAVDEVLSPRAEEKGIEISVVLDDGVPPVVLVDPLRMRQILLNLGGNAVKFTDEGRVDISAVWTERRGLTVLIHDTGIGIDPAYKATLFEAFTQADASHARRHKGTGLGLSIVRRLVHLMGGSIDVTSNPGEGSTFTFTVPAPRTEPEATAAPEQVATAFEGRILLVEDDPVSRFVAQKLLEEAGCEVETAEDGLEAVAAVGTGTYDLVLMDCQMPILDGYEATARIRQLEQDARHLPIIAMTASISQAESDRCRFSGMDDFLGKPLDAERVRAVLARWLAKPEA